MSLSVRMYIDINALKEDDTTEFRGRNLSDREHRPHIYANDTETADRFADVTVAASAYDNVIMRAYRTLGEYALGGARGVLTLCDGNSDDRYHITITGGNYSDVVTLYRAVLIGSILPVASYEGGQKQDPAAVKLEEVRLLVYKHIDQEATKEPMRDEIISLCTDILKIIE